MKWKVSINDVIADASLKAQDGWVNMAVRWLITDKTVGSKKVTFGRTVLKPNSEHQRHTHPNAEEVVYIVRGHGTALVDNDEFPVGPGDAVYVPKDTVHVFRNKASEDLEVVFTYSGAANLEKAGYRPLEARRKG